MEGSEKSAQLKGKRQAGSAQDRGGTSLFHQILSRRTFLNTQDDAKSLLHRLVFMSKISPDLADKRELGEFWDHHFLSLQRYFQGESVTGLLLLYPSYAVHVIESSSDALYSVLKTLKDMNQPGSSAFLLDHRILVMSHNIPNRLFHHWSYKVLNVPASHLAYADQGEPVESIVSECLTKLLKFGMHLLKYPKASKNLPDAVLEKVPQLIVPQATISHLLQCKELLTPGQYLQAYDSPLNILMDADVVWPTPVAVRPFEIRS
ncbi:testis-expressed protein 47-like isoform X2 [Ambystoma mexicanum]|uniref:testis-expressed protein 47-like isoform X2 n=1 Tax=Ambystoma mexicanum TaxID=8296 RepID=UPI0037E71C68